MDVPLFLWRNPKLSDKDPLYPHYIKMDKDQESRSMESGDLE